MRARLDSKPSAWSVTAHTIPANHLIYSSYRTPLPGATWYNILILRFLSAVLSCSVFTCLVWQQYSTLFLLTRFQDFFKHFSVYYKSGSLPFLIEHLCTCGDNHCQVTDSNRSSQVASAFLWHYVTNLLIVVWLLIPSSCRQGRNAKNVLVSPGSMFYLSISWSFTRVQASVIRLSVVDRF